MRRRDELLYSHAQALLHSLNSVFCPLLVCLKTAKSRSKKRLTLLNATVLKLTYIYISTKKTYTIFQFLQVRAHFFLLAELNNV